MRLYWRYKKDGKWTWKAVPEGQITKAMEFAGDSKNNLEYQWVEEE